MQHQEAVDLAAREHLVLGDARVHLGDVAAHHLEHAGVLGQFLIGGVGDVVALGPVADRGKVDVEEGGADVAAVAEDHGFEDVGVELELVLHVFRREEAAVGHLADVLGAVDDAQVAGPLLDEAGVAGGDPAFGVLGRGGGFVVLVIAHEGAGRAVEDLAALVDAQLDAGAGHADGVGADLVVGLLGDEHRRLGLAVELFEVDAEGAVEIEDLGPDRLAGGVADADAGKAQRVLERAVDQQVAEAIAQTVEGADRLAVEDGGADAAGERPCSGGRASA